MDIFFTNSGKMLNFVKFKNRGTCVHRGILDVMLRTLSNLLITKIMDSSEVGF